VTDVRITPSGIYGTAHRGADQFDVILSRDLPRWDAINSGSYLECDLAEWRRFTEQR